MNGIRRDELKGLCLNGAQRNCRGEGLIMDSWKRLILGLMALTRFGCK